MRENCAVYVTDVQYCQLPIDGYEKTPGIYTGVRELTKQHSLFNCKRRHVCRFRPYAPQKRKRARGFAVLLHFNCGLSPASGPSGLGRAKICRRGDDVGACSFVRKLRKLRESVRGPAALSRFNRDLSPTPPLKGRYGYTRRILRKRYGIVGACANPSLSLVALRAPSWGFVYVGHCADFSPE